MKRNFWLALVMAALLAGCGDSNVVENPPPGGNPPGGGSATASPAESAGASKSFDESASKVMQSLPGELAGYLHNLNAPVNIDLGRLLGLPGSGAASAALADAPGGGVSVQATETRLTRGSWDCTGGNNSCVRTDSDDYLVRWRTAQGQTAELLLDWNGSTGGTPSPTVMGHYSASNEALFEAPTKLIGYIKVNNVVVASLNRSTVFPDSRCVTGRKVLDMPDQMKVAAFLDKAGVGRLIEVKNLEWNIGSTLTTKGDIVARGGGETVNLTWDVTTGGTVVRARCGNFASILATNMRALASLGNLKKTFALSFEATEFRRDPLHIAFSKGSVQFDGKTAEFRGVLDDTNRNCILGENLTLSFAGGQSNLEQYLIEHHAAKPCTR
ncbi:hypothetical protein [Meiothermus sp. CFH 77666]|uniref:hypothetical protein n=1 Tax=Meiothermus sp. CFH 77666 TaxID=2817942 RepID=UPI001AA03484|nr:hypothetical protein [Meiothermus sp. CFH 77666]MBO1438456.1 hypothetical protein [Meiothermus sp. CFH 77666]